MSDTVVSNKISKTSFENLDDVEKSHILFTSSRDGDINTITEILKYIKNIDEIAENRKKTACWIATYRAHNDVLKLLLENGANPNIPDSDGVFPLYFAIGNENVEAVSLLLNHGADLSLTDNRGKDLRYYVDKCENSQIIKIANDF